MNLKCLCLVCAAFMTDSCHGGALNVGLCLRDERLLIEVRDSKKQTIKKSKKVLDNLIASIYHLLTLFAVGGLSICTGGNS